jgi:hypothetical protein
VFHRSIVLQRAETSPATAVRRLTPTFWSRFEATLRQAKAPLERLYSMAGEWASWKNYSNGDKDLWHLAWMIEGVNFTFVP